MFLADYHLHTKFSPDSTEEIDNICAVAAQLGIKQIAVTDHLCVNQIVSGVWPEYDDDLAAEYIFDAIDRHKGNVDIVYGIELGQPLQAIEKAKAALKKNKFQFIIASLHNISNHEDFYFLDFDKLTDKEIKNMYDSYVDELFAHIEFEPFNVLGHITYPLRYLYEYNKKFDFSIYYDRLQQLFKKLVQMGKGIEINTSGLRQKIGETLPTLDVAKLYKDCGGEIITVGSDAHTAHDVGSSIKQTYTSLNDIGFKYVSTYLDGKFKQEKIG